MTVKKLIEELKQFDENLLVVISGIEDTYEPSPREQIFHFDSGYYTGSEFKKLPANEKFVQL